jgi:membrane peptidoglycan carboxypeptidase
VSSKADDFDVRFRDGRDARDGRAWGNGADGGHANGGHGDGGYAGNDHGAVGGTVDYDLGYDANGWDTQGFRSPTAGYLDNHETAELGDGGVGTAGRPKHGRENGRDDGPANGYGPAHGYGNGRGGSHARTAGTQQAGAQQAGTQQAGAQQAGAQQADTQAWAPEVPGSTGPWLPDQTGQTGQTGQLNQPGRRARTGGSHGPQGPLGPQGPRGPRGPRVKVKGSWWRHWTWRKALGVMLGIIGGFIVLGAVVVAIAYEETPVPTEAMAATGYAQSLVYSSNGTLIGRFGSTDRQMLSYNQIPQSMINAVLAAEDRHFWTEGGVSPTGILRASYEDVTGNDGSLQGGSTITQEFVRQYYQGIGTQQTLSRKIKEIFVAMKVAKEKSKQWILQNYLNTVYMGNGAYGVQAAAETYFNKPVAGLTVAQDAVIAAVVQQPSTYPQPQYRPELEARWRYVINGMVQMGALSAQKGATLKFPALGDHVAQSVGTDVWDPYVLNMVRAELKNTYHFTEAQIDDGGYVIKTSIDDTKMAALYAAISQNEQQIDNSAYPFKSYMHAGAVLEDPATGAIQAVYAGPGFPESKYNGTGKVITAKQCQAIQCQYDMATVNREQVGSSFKPYILATAVKEGMNVQSSTLDGYTPLSIPPDSQPTAYPQTAAPPGSAGDGWSLQVNNDSPGENGPYPPQIAMAASINTAYANLWHVVAGPDGMNVLDMAQSLGVDINDPDSGMYKSKDEATLALGQASLTVAEQASMLATLDDNGVYHDAHLIVKLTQNNVQTLIKVTSGLVFNSNPMQNAEMDSQVQYAMSEDTASYGTAPVAAMSNGQQIIAKTGTTETAQSAFFVGAIPTQALAVALFTHDQNGKKDDPQSLNLLGGQSQGGFGGTWPATIWHTYAENMFVPLGVEKFQPVVFTGTKWNEVPPNLRSVGKKHPKKKNNNNQNPNPGNGGFPSPPPGNGNPNPYPTYSCDPSVVTCNPNAPGGGGDGNTQSVSAIEADAAMGGIVAGLPAMCLWVRRRTRRGVTKRG